MQLKSILAAAGMLAVLAVLMPTPALAQVAGTTPVCANCHENQNNSTIITAHGAKNDANGSMCAGVPRRRH